MGNFFKNLKDSCILIGFLIIIEFISKYILAKIDCNIINLLREYLNIDKELYMNFLICAIGIAGVFLALYYSNISTIYSSEYNNTPNKIRRLFAYEINNNESICKINKYIIFTSLTLFINMVGIETWYVFIIISIIKTIDIIISFINKGNGIYEYANIYNVLKARKKDLIFSLRMVSKNNYFYNNTIQDVCGKNALNVLNDMSLVNNYILEKEDKNKKEAIMEYINENLYVLVIYLQDKNKIMFNSLWFQKVIKHKKWYNSDFSERGIALYTGTELQPRNISDLDWFEKRILDMNEDGIRFLIRNNCNKEIKNYLNLIIESIPFWIKYGNINLLYEHVKIVVNEIQKKLLECPCKPESEMLEVLEFIKIIMIDFILKTREYILSIDLLQYKKFTNRKYRFNDTNFKEMNDPIINNNEFYNVYKGLKNEKKIERHIITPEWYIKQRIARVYANRLNQLIICLKKIYFLNNEMEEKLFESSQYEYSSSFIINENELYNKIQMLYKDTNIIFQDIQNSNVVEQNIIPIIKMQDVINEINTIHNDKIPTLWTRHCEIWGIKKAGNARDVFGFCYNNLSEYIFSAIIKFDYDNFEKNYHNILRLAILSEISIHEELESSTEYNDFAKLKFQFSGLNNIFKLSGYAVIVGEILNDKRWKRKIDDELEKLVNKSDTINFIEQIKRWKIAIEWLVDDIRNIEIDSTNMEMRFREAIEQSNKLKFEYIGPFGHKKIVNTKNLEKLYYDDTLGISSDMREIFAIACLNKYLDPNDIYTTKRMKLKEWEEENEEE